jgi:hypothetical protein
MDNMNNHEPNNTLPPPSAALLARWTLNPVQAAFLATDARFSFYVGGVGAGKTTAGALRALAWALDHPGSTTCSVATNRRRSCTIGAKGLRGTRRGHTAS